MQLVLLKTCRGFAIKIKCETWNKYQTIFQDMWVVKQRSVNVSKLLSYHVCDVTDGGSG